MRRLTLGWLALVLLGATGTFAAPVAKAVKLAPLPDLKKLSGQQLQMFFDQASVQLYEIEWERGRRGLWPASAHGMPWSRNPVNKQQKALVDVRLAGLADIVAERILREQQQTKPMSAEQVYAECANSCVLIRTFGATGGTGTGFCWSDGGVVTNFHVISGCSRIEVVYADGTVKSAEAIQWADREHDLAIIQVPKRVENARLGKSLGVDGAWWKDGRPPVGATLYVIGNPNGLQQSISNGILSGVRQLNSFSQLGQMTVPVSPGNSGSPVLNTSGEVVGVVVSSLKNGQNLNFFVPASYLPFGELKQSMPLGEWETYSQ